MAPAARLVASLIRPIVGSAALGVVLFVAAPVRAQQNLSFETHVAEIRAIGDRVPGWELSQEADAVIALDTTVAHGGDTSLRIARSRSGGRERFSQEIDAQGLATNRVRVSAHVKTDSDSNVTANLRIRVDAGTQLLYIDRTEPQALRAGEWTHIEIQAPLASTAQRLEFGGELSGAGVAWFDDFEIEAVDTQILPAPSAAAARYIGQALAIIDEHSVVRAELDWPAFHAAVLQQARGAVTTTDAHLAVQFALASLSDGHSYFMSPRQMENLNERPVGNARTSRAPRPPRAELLGDSVAYLQLPGFAGGDHLDRVAFAENLQRLIASLDSAGACGWIIDLRDNQGGNLWPMLAGVGPLLGEGDAGASVRPDGERRIIWYRDGKVGLGDFVQLRVRGEPSRLRRPDTAVAVITDDETASAAEIVAAAFAARPRTRSFGAATRGATTATRTFPLYDTAALMLAVALTTDRNGRVINGPITPDEPVATGDYGQELPQQPAIQAARRWLASQPCSGATASGS
jgi:C-terminal processing protease CtpA/Prc